MPLRSTLKTARVVAGALAGVGLLAFAASALPAPWSLVGLTLIALAALVGVAFAVDMVVPGANLLSRARTRLPPEAGAKVALTFDDGPIEPFTREILDVLDAHGAKATFFCIGDNVRKAPELAREIVRRGHDVENHSDHHALLPLCGTRRMRGEIAGGAQAIEDATGRRPRYLRCPKGYKSPRVARHAATLAQELMGFSYPIFDVENPPPEDLVERALGRARPGAILLMHDGYAAAKPGSRSSLVTALPQIIEGLRARGLEPVSLGQALGHRSRVAAAAE
jgi:peptidoglycan/xylan/chitin deacetylase (PgdA/CDA1 family)